MATKSQTDRSRAEEFAIDPTEHLNAEDVDDETPRHVLVEVSNNGRSMMAIVAAGTAGRWSFDFGVDHSGIEIERAFEEGMRTNVDELPVWMDPVQEQVVDLVLGN
jgi:hypothetical protein